LSVDGGSVEVTDGRFGLGWVTHGDEGVSLVSDMDILHAAELAEGILQHLFRTVAVDAVNEQLGAAVGHAAGDVRDEVDDDGEEGENGLLAGPVDGSEGGDDVREVEHEAAVEAFKVILLLMPRNKLQLETFCWRFCSRKAFNGQRGKTR